jgi:plasmid stabilization system protein ParE
MKYTVVFLPLVSFDLKDAIDYYKEINPNLAKQFLSRLREAQHFLISNPYIFN